MSPSVRFNRTPMFAAVALWSACSPLCVPLCAQDTRNVVEPALPTGSSVCSVLQAQIATIVSTTATEPAGSSAYEPAIESEAQTSADTSRIQSALTACGNAGGGAVELTASGPNNAFLIEPITLPSKVILLVDAGVTVFGSRNPADYQNGTPSTSIGTCGVDDAVLNNGCVALFSSQNTTGAGIMGYGIIDGRGNNYLQANGTLLLTPGSPYPATGAPYSWYDNSSATGNTMPASHENNPMLIATVGAANFTLYKITLRNSPTFHLNWVGNSAPAAVTSGLTVWDTKIKSPYNIELTDGIDTWNNVTNITVANSFISNGDDMIAMASYATGEPVSNVTVQDLHTYSGLGVSIGEETQGGITNVLVNTVYQNGYYPFLSNGIGGLQIKSSADHGGLVQNVTYENICQQNEVSSIRFASVPQYNKTLSNPIYPPQYTNIAIHNMTVLPNQGSVGPQISFMGYGPNNIETVTLDNVNVQGTPSFTTDNTSVLPEEYAAFSFGPGPVTSSLLNLANLGPKVSGPDITYSGSVTNPGEAPFACLASSFQPLAGELFASTASSTNLNSLSTTAPAAFSLNAVIEPVSDEYAALTNPITFYDGGTAVGSAAIGGNGTLATLSLSGIAAGTHTYTAQYPTDGNYGVFSFGSVTINVAAAANPALSMTATPSSLSLDPGSSGSSAISIAPMGGFTGSVTLACSSPVPYLTCTVTVPAAITNTTATTATATLSVAATYAKNFRPDGDRSRAEFAACLPFAAFLLLSLCLSRRRSIQSLVLFALLTGSALMATGCSGNSGSSSPGPPPAGTQTVTLTATGASVTATTTITVTIL